MKCSADFEAVAGILDQIGTNPFQVKDQELTNYRTYKQEILRSDQLDLHRRMIALEFLHTRVSKVATEHREKYKEAVDVARDTWLALSCMFPRFFYRKADKHLRTSYKLEDVEKELNPIRKM